jgi:hypothetical protein
MSKHTPGPWKIASRPRKSFASGKLMYRVDGPEIISDYEDWGYTKESARLIAAAPELLEALKALLSLHDDPMPYDAATTRAAARAAIAKATEA